MKRLLMAITLACVLSGTGLAGEMPTVSPATVAGDMPTVSPIRISSEKQSRAVITVVLTIISLIGR